LHITAREKGLLDCTLTQTSEYVRVRGCACVCIRQTKRTTDGKKVSAGGAKGDAGKLDTA